MANDSVAKPSPDYVALKPTWQMIRDINGGTEDMRAAGTTYLPQEPAEPEADYTNRVARSVFTNFYAEIVDRYVGRPLKDPIVLDEDVPGQIRDMTQNIDLQGSDINTFARKVFKAAIDDGVTHVLVDYPVTQSEDVSGAFPDGSLTLEQEQNLGVRPYAIHIDAMDLIGWKFITTTTGRKILTQIRYIERVRKPDPENEFLQVIVNRVRVYEIGRVRVFEEVRSPDRAKDADWIMVAEYATSLDFIPLVTMYTNRVGFMVGRPLLEDLAYLNIAHWQSDSDQRNIVHVARVPILFATGLGTAEESAASFQIQVGAGTFTRGPKGADLKFVELQGKSIESGQADLNDLEERMEAMGLSLLIKKPTGSETATGDTIDKANEESALGAMARTLERTLEDILDLFAMWMNMGEDAGGQVTVFKDFGVALGADKDIEILQKDRDAGALSRRTYWTEAKRRSILNDDFDPDDEEALLEAETAAGLMQGEETDQTANQVGDSTGSADGHTHTLMDNGVTDEVNGHTHTWNPAATETGSASGHSHTLSRRSNAMGVPSSQQISDDDDDVSQTA